MKENGLKAELFWGSIHATSSVIEVLVEKNVSNSESKNEFTDHLLSLTSTKEENLLSFLDVIQNKSLREICADMVSDMYLYDFDNTSSVMGEKITEERINMTNHDILMHITLMQHSFGVVNKMYKLVGQKYGTYSDLFLVIALLHDFGKSIRLREDWFIDKSLDHEVASAEYLRKVYIQSGIDKNYVKMLEKVCSVLEAHHSKDKQNEFYPIKKGQDDDTGKQLEIMLLEKLCEADKLQRVEEIRLMENTL